MSDTYECDGCGACCRTMLFDVFEQGFLRALLLRELRQGALENSMAEAIAEVIGADASIVLRAVMLSGELADVAIAAMKDGAAGLQQFRLHLFRPVRPMLARSASSPADALERNAPASVEAKIDGARVQVHKQGERVAVYTRNLRNVTRFLPDVVEAAGSIAADSAILDGEVIALDGAGRPQPFQVTMSRFGRQLDVEQARRATPLTAFTVVVPERVPPLGLVPMAMAMLSVAVVTVLPKESCTVTCTAGEMDAPAVVLLGCTVKASWEAAPTAMLKVPLVAPVSPVAEATRV